MCPDRGVSFFSYISGTCKAAEEEAREKEEKDEEEEVMNPCGRFENVAMKGLEGKNGSLTERLY